MACLMACRDLSNCNYFTETKVFVKCDLIGLVMGVPVRVR